MMSVHVAPDRSLHVPKVRGEESPVVATEVAMTFAPEVAPVMDVLNDVAELIDIATVTALSKFDKSQYMPG
jgi:hypothetical protein